MFFVVGMLMGFFSFIFCQHFGFLGYLCFLLSLSCSFSSL